MDFLLQAGRVDRRTGCLWWNHQDQRQKRSSPEAGAEGNHPPVVSLPSERCNGNHCEVRETFRPTEASDDRPGLRCFRTGLETARRHDQGPMESTPTLFQSWTPYEVVMDQNYLFHRELHDRASQILGARFAPGRFDLLDLGCGSARHLAGILREHPPSTYRGYDLSAQALELARVNLAFLGDRVRLMNADLALGPGSGPADVVFSAFAIHHLDTAAKADLFRSIRPCLRPGGMFLLIDVVRNEDEDRAKFLDRFEGEIRSQWGALAARDVDEIIDHVRRCDFPETDSGIRDLARAAGLGGGEEPERHGCHQLWCFDRD